MPWALARRRSPGLVYATFIAVAGIGTACLSFGTQWAFTNAFIPGVCCRPSPSASPPAASSTTRGAAAARSRRVYLLARALDPVRAGRPLAPSLCCRPPRRRRSRPTGYDPRPFIPTARDRVAGDALIARLRATPGEVLIPFHPFYAHLAGKPTFLHRMGVMDVNASLGTPKGLAEGLHARRWSLVVFDDKIRGTEFQWPGLMEQYVPVDHIAGPHTVSGALTVPSLIFAPKPIIDRDLQ